MDIGRKNKESFWPSYVDIMTTLFAVMLILFAVSYARFKLKEGQLEMLVKEYKDIIDVYSKVDSIDKSSFYAYDSLYLKHTITISIAYQDKEYDIHKLKLDQTGQVEQANEKRDSIRQAGILAQNIIKELEENSSSSNNIKFLVVIEGQSSKIPFYEGEWKNNETLSFLRAKYLKKFWTDPVSKGGCGLFQKTSENDINSKCEIIVAGSGEGGVPRHYYIGDDNLSSFNPADEKFLSFEDVKRKASEEEYKAWYNVEIQNQRFLINIIPIIGNIDVTKTKMKNIVK